MSTSWGRRIAAVVAATTVVTVAFLPSVPTTAGAQDTSTATSDAATVDVLSVSPWVTPDGTWTARLRIAGAPPDARIGYSIRQPPTGTEAEVRAAMIAGREGDEETKVMRGTVTSDLAAITAPDGITTLTIPIRGGSGDRSRVLIPNRGAYPVVVTISSPTAGQLGRVSLSMNRLPDDDRAPFSLGLVVDAPATAGFDASGRPAVTPTLRSTVAGLADRLTAIGRHPVRAALRSEALVALDSTGDAADARLVEQLRGAAADATFMGVGWADLDVEAWARADALGVVQTSIVDGQQASFLRLRRPVDTRLWPVDPTVGPAAVQLLGRLGVSGALFDTDRLVGARGPAGETGFTRPFRVRGDDGATLDGIAVDPELEDLLEAGGDEPALTAHRVVTQLFATWTVDTAERGAVLRLGPATSPDVITALVEAVTSDPEPASTEPASTEPASTEPASTEPAARRPIELVDPLTVTELPPATTGGNGREQPWTREVATTSGGPDVGPLARRLESARPVMDDYAAVMPPGDEEAARFAIIAQRGLDRGVDPTTTADAVAAAVEAVDADLDRITAPDPRSIWVTSRTASIPLRFTNDTGRAVRVRLRLQSPRLTFVDGAEQELTLQPGVNRIPVEVDVRASGQFLMQAELVAPSSDRVLASTRQRIRSRAFSGVGLMLSGGALLFLVIWWTRTLRSKRRVDQAARDAAGDGDGPPVTTSDHSDGVRHPDPASASR